MKRFFGALGYLVFCVIALAIGSGIAFIERNPLAYAAAVHGGYVPFVPKPEPFAGRNDIYILMLGCDEDRYYARPGSGQEGQVLEQRARTDTMQLVRLDFENKSVGMLQIPRDTMVEVPGYYRMKINGLHVAGGVDASVAGVAQLTGITPDRVVLLDYDAIVKMIDEVGGVEVEVPRRMRYEDERGGLHIDLEKGKQTLDGETALGYLRFRRDSDFHRGKRQQDFMMAFKDEVTESVTGFQVFRMANLAMQVVNGGLTADEFIAIGEFAKNVPPANIKQGVLPVVDGSGSELLFVQDRLHEALVESGMVDDISGTTSQVSHRQ
jgi:LCP family protein required for cell wall assembly